MIERYTRKEMGQVWTPENRWQKILNVEIALAQAQADLKLIPKSAALAIRKKAKFSLERIAEIEKETKHDVIAFVTNVAENVGPDGRYVHFGMTSSDALDTALSLQIREAGVVLMSSFTLLETSLLKAVKTHAETLCMGRTHGIFAEPLTFGLKLASFLAELQRNKERVQRALKQVQVIKMSGAVGTYSGQGPQVEARVGKILNLKPETIASQVVPRDRHAELFQAIALLGTGLERLSVELRHLQRSEVGEVCEGFSLGQKGSSAMPHKKNPISAENISGLARLLRAYAASALENVVLWHERDISHSSVERVIFPDAFIVADYALSRMTNLIENLEVRPERMKEILAMSQGQVFSSQVLLALVEKGLSREEAYRKVQALAHGLKAGESLKDKILQDVEMKKFLNSKQVEKIFQGERNKKYISILLKRLVQKKETKKKNNA